MSWVKSLFISRPGWREYNIKCMSHYTIGIDEVGRGPLAGPVVVCALLLKAGWSLREAERRSNLLPPLRDSKKLSATQRELWYKWIKNHPQIKFAVSRVYPRGIERLNISQAANLAATRATLRLLALFPPPSPEGGPAYRTGRGAGGGCSVLLDGGLHLKSIGSTSSPNNYSLSLSKGNIKTIIKGDEKIPAIKLASIVAKVVRDRFMAKLHKKYPQYGFDKHKGYGTAAHLAAIKKFGPADVHRKTFLSGVDI